MPQIYSTPITCLNTFMYWSLILITLYLVVNIILVYFLILKFIIINILIFYFSVSDIDIDHFFSYFQHKEEPHLITRTSVKLYRWFELANFAYERRKKKKNYWREFLLLRSIDFNLVTYKSYIFNLNWYLQIKTINNFFFGIRRFSAWQILKKINNLIIKKIRLIIIIKIKK